jgi:lysophospholipase L1-like esterase
VAAGKILTKRANHHARGARSLRRTPDEARLGAWSRVGLVILGVLIGALAGELLARLVGFEFRPHMRNRVYFAEPHPLYGWRNRPGLAGTYGGDEFTTFVTINEAGQRGPSHPVARVPGKRRIAVLGDSQTWGDGVADDETFVARLDGGDTEVLSFATPGWGTDQQLLVFDNEAARYAPDVVVVALFIGNDLFDNTSRGTFQYPKPYFTLEDGDRLELHGVPVPYSRAMHALIEVYRGLMRHSALLNAIAETTRKDWRAPSEADTPQKPVVTLARAFYLDDLTEEERMRIAMTTRLLRELVRHIRAIGAEPVVLIIPEIGQVDVFADAERRAATAAAGVDFRRPQRVFSAALESDGVQVIDALPALGRATRASRAAGGSGTYYREWRHLNALGHAVIADLLAARLGVKRRPARATSAAAADGAPNPPSPPPTDRSEADSRSRS